RQLLTALAALFSAYHVFLGIHSFGLNHAAWPPIVAMVIYAIASILSLTRTGEIEMAKWLAWINVGVAVGLPTLVTSALERSVETGHAAWYVGAAGTPMTITMVRRRRLCAWLGIAFLVGQSIWWVGPINFIFIGVLGGIVWVGVADIL